MRKLNKKLLRVLLLIVSTIPLLSSCKKNTPKLNVEELKNICEIAVLECYYHNLAKIHKDADGLFASDSTMWIDYTSTVKVGFDVSKIKITINDNTVKIELPEAKALEEPKIDEKSITTVTSKKAAEKISTEKKLSAIEDAKKAIIDELNQNSNIKKTAENRLKRILKNYIEQIGVFSGISYEVEWESLEEKTGNVETSQEN